jgi:hypothetical protein
MVVRKLGCAWSAPSSTRTRRNPLRLAVRIVAGVVLLAGVVFFFQGIGVLPGSFMTGRSEWAIVGAALVAGAAALFWLSGLVRKDGSA